MSGVILSGWYQIGWPYFDLASEYVYERLPLQALRESLGAQGGPIA